VPSAVVARAIASLQKKRASRQVEWNRLCAAEGKRRAERDELNAFVERYLNLRDRLARDVDDWDEGSRSLYIYAVLREVRRERKRRSMPRRVQPR
jgi:hypothetical protein